MKRHFCVCLFLLISIPGFAQLYPTQYRPPNLQWQQLATPHFTIVFPAGEDSAAWQTGRILESQYNAIQPLTGGELTNFPVVLNNYNDRSNGFVTSFHFRSEIEMPPIKGKALNPQSGNWLETVEPHELVHAMQFSNTGGFGIGGLINLFSPDFARSLHGAIPIGVAEGLAVHHETKGVAPDGGRGSYPWFHNQFNTIFNSSGRWSMGQMLQSPSRTRPFNRHYIGGFEFTSWLQQTYGDGASRDALNFYIDLPFLGYGVALKHATGKWPGQLYNEFKRFKKSQLQKNSNTYRHPVPLNIPFEGADIREPKWLNDSTLIFYGSFYNARPGFYRYDLDRQRLSQIVTTASVPDYNYDLSADKSRIIYSYFRSSPIYDNTFLSELVEVNLKNGTSERLTHRGRIYAPVYDGRNLLALQTWHASSKLVAYNPRSKNYTDVASPGEHQIIEVAVNPADTTQLAVLINKRGMQALWITSRRHLRQDLEQAPDISFAGGSVFDPAWHPKGDKLLFTADIESAMNIYEYDLSAREVTQVTHTRYNAFEGSYDIAGNRIAFILQKENERLPAVISRRDFPGSVIDSSLWSPSAEKIRFMQRPVLGAGIDTGHQDWKTSSYSNSFFWLKPRAVVPVIEETSRTGVYEVGASLHSNNLLQHQSYSLQATLLQNQPWFDLDYRNTAFFPGFKLSLFRRPAFISGPAGPDLTVESRTFLREERGASLSIPVDITLDRNVFNSSFTVEPEIRQSQIQIRNLDGEAVSNRAHATVANIYSALRYRVQQNIRDVQPNSGAILFSEFEQFLSSNRLALRGEDNTAPFNDHPFGLRGGLYSFFSPNKAWNQSLRIGLLALKQSAPIFNSQFLVSDGFSEQVFPGSRNLASFSTRYTIPLFFVDDGGFLLPLYLSHVYLAVFSNTVSIYTKSDPISNSRSVFGAGVRGQFRLGNLSFEIGVGIGYEPTRNNTRIFIGNF